MTHFGGFTATSGRCSTAAIDMVDQRARILRPPDLPRPDQAVQRLQVLLEDERGAVHV